MDTEGWTLAVILWRNTGQHSEPRPAGQLLGSVITVRGIRTSLEQLYIWWQYTQASTHDS